MRPAAPTHPARRLQRIGVVLHPQRDCAPVVETVRAWADRARFDLVGVGADEAVPQRAGGTVAAHGPARLGQQIDLVLAVGGDGTILRALALAAPHGAPVLGINLGHLGFLAEVDPPGLPAALAAVQDGRYRIEQRVALAVSGTDPAGASWVAAAYNDAVLSRPAGHGPIALAVYVDEMLFARYAADAVMIATPTGSTAYNFSAGGPIVSPRLEAFLVTPVASHAVFNRTVVVHPDERLRVQLAEASAMALVEIDGRTHTQLRPGAQLQARRSAQPGRLLRLGGTNFYARARGKLHLGDPPALGLSAADVRS